MLTIASVLLAATPPVVLSPIRLSDPVRTGAEPREQRLITWMPSETRCGDEIVPVVSGRRPYNDLGWTGAPPKPDMRYRFSIDADGRTHSIMAEETAPARGTSGGPAVATTRYAAGQPRVSCRVSYRAVYTPFDQAGRAELASYVMTNRTPRLPREALNVLQEGDGCRDGTQPLQRAFPEFATLPATPGVRDWTMIGFDVDPDGVPRNVRPLYGTGNEDLAKASADAVARSRFNAGPLRKNCSYPYWRAAAILPAPALPEVESNTVCDSRAWKTPLNQSYPRAYSERMIEGWAVIRYDVASWGEIGNLEIVDAQPSMDFGVAAKRMLERASKEPGDALSGCVDVVRYVMPPRRDDEDRVYVSPDS